MAAILVSEVAMPADNKSPVVNLRLTPDFLAQIDEYRFERRFKTRMGAIKYLLNWALERHPEPTAEEREQWS